MVAGSGHATGRVTGHVDIEKLMEYWAHGEGAAKIGWGSDDDFARCEVQLGKYVHNPEELAGL